MRRLAPILLTLASAAVAPRADAQTVETFVLAVGGQSQVTSDLKCSTFGPATPALFFFPNVSTGVPTDGLVFCGIAGEFRTNTSATAPVGDTTTVDTTFNTLPPNTVTGDASANAAYGVVGAEAHAALVGPTNSLLVDGATSYGLFDETLTATSPAVAAGTSGTIRLTFDVAGAVSMTGGNGLADVEIDYDIQSAGGQGFTLMRVQVNGAATDPFVSIGNGAPVPPTFTSAPGSFSGSGSVTGLDRPFTWGTPFHLKAGVLAEAGPSPDATCDVDFATTVTLTGIQLFANGQPMPRFALASGSGTYYDWRGVHLPEPGSAAEALVALSSLAVVGRRRRRGRIGA
jgi:hypothetical protein